jgi:hypothetical protein
MVLRPQLWRGDCRADAIERHSGSAQSTAKDLHRSRPIDLVAASFAPLGLVASRFGERAAKRRHHADL